MSSSTLRALTLSASALLLTQTGSTAAAAKLKVPGQFATIQAAVDAAQPGDKILVEKGVYPEAVSIVNKLSVTLRGKPGATIDAGGAQNGIGIINCEDVVVDRLLVRNCGRGVLVVGSSGVTVKRVEVSDTAIGVKTESSSSQVTIEKCFVSGGTHGAFLQGSGITVTRTTVRDVTNEGIMLGAVGSSATDCEVTNAGSFGIRVSGDNLVQGNRISSCGIGIKISKAAGTTIDSNVITDSATLGIRVSKNSPDLVLSKNVISKSGTHGIQFGVASSALLVKNKVAKSGQDGLRINGNALPCVVKKNKVMKSGAVGFRIQGSDSLFVKNTAQKSADVDLFDTGEGNVFEANSFGTIAP